MTTYIKKKDGVLSKLRAEFEWPDESGQPQRRDDPIKQLADKSFEREKNSSRSFMRIPFVCYDYTVGEEIIELERITGCSEEIPAGLSMEQKRGLFYCICMTLVHISQYRDHLDFGVREDPPGSLHNLFIRKCDEGDYYYPIFFDFNSGFYSVSTRVVNIVRGKGQNGKRCPVDITDLLCLDEIHHLLFGKGIDTNKGLGTTVAEYFRGYLRGLKDEEVRDCERYYAKCVKDRLKKKIKQYDADKEKQRDKKTQELESKRKYYEQVKEKIDSNDAGG